MKEAMWVNDKKKSKHQGIRIYFFKMKKMWNKKTDCQVRKKSVRKIKNHNAQLNFIYFLSKNVEDFHSWTKSPKTQSEAKQNQRKHKVRLSLSLDPFYFCWKKGKRVLKVETLVVLNPNF
jgi:hypothetical protein